MEEGGEERRVAFEVDGGEWASAKAHTITTLIRRRVRELVGRGENHFLYIHEYSALRDIHTHRPMTTTNWEGRRGGKVVELNLNTYRREYKSGSCIFYCLRALYSI